MFFTPEMFPNLANKQRAVLEAAMALFDERGFHGTSMPDIYRSAGVSTGTVYHYFSSKEALVNQLYLLVKGEEGRRILDGFPITGSPQQQFLHYWRAQLQFANEFPRAFSFTQYHFHKPYLNAECAAVDERLLGLARMSFDAAHKAGVIRNVPSEVLFPMVHGSMLGLVRAAMDGFLTLTDEVVEQSGRCAWELIAA